MQAFRLTIEYEGTRYSGWQEQRNASTVQGVLRGAIEGVVGDRVELGGAGRTDAGVHALAQTAHLRMKRRMRPHELLYAVNDRLPADVAIVRVEPVSATFHARHDAKLRSYVYQIATRRTAFSKRFVWWIKDELDVRAMHAAAALFAGEHDFAAFCQRERTGDSTVVAVDESRVERVGDLIVFRIAASHFLWKMVRRLAGTLVAVGRGQLGAGDVTAMRDRSAADAAELTAPPSGLFLEQVLYRGESRRPFGPVIALPGATRP